jgi:hypothetical protein
MSTRWAEAWIGVSIALGALGGCAKIVGIEDTVVTDGGSGGNESASGGTAQAGSAHAGASHAGTANAGTSNAGTSNAGSANAGSANAGTENAGADNAGQSNGGSSAGGAATAGSGTGGASGGTAGGSGGAVNQAGNAGTAGNGGSAGASECPCSAPKPTCENGKCVVRGPTMAKATSYYVDSTEVSKAEYDVFLKAKGTDTSGQIAECTWNTSYAPQGPAVDDPRPIVDVDWCDAAAYCAWADKRLCGNIAGGPVAATDLNDATKSQMYLACAGNGNERYPYGGFTYKAGYCNFGDYMADVGTFPMCEGHYTGMFDLIGNAAEWIDSCDGSGGTDHSKDLCQLGGGSYIKSDYNCQIYIGDYTRSDHADLFGFRCCSK